jgi:hypothetical protein
MAALATGQLETLDRGACHSAEVVGLQLADAKRILGRLQEIVVSEQLQRYCEAVRLKQDILGRANGTSLSSHGARRDAAARR